MANKSKRAIATARAIPPAALSEHLLQVNPRLAVYLLLHTEQSGQREGMVVKKQHTDHYPGDTITEKAQFQ